MKHYQVNGVKCLCGASEFAIIMEGEYSWFLQDGGAVPFQALRCVKCNLVLTNPPPFAHYESDQGTDSSVMRASSQYRINRLRPYINSETKILDIGCSTGTLVEAATKMGVKESVGVELSLDKAEHGRNLGRDIRSTYLEECGFSDSYFNIVQAHHTLEHILDLHGILCEISRILKPGGIFYVTQARYNSPIVRSANWVGWFPQEHYWHFTERTLKTIIESHGFKLKHFNCPLHTEYGTEKNVMYPIKRMGKLAVKYLNLGDMVDATFVKLEINSE